jgi:flagellar motor switch protein FliM
MATSLLTSDELSALAEGVKDGSIPVDTGFNTAARVKKHDLASENSSLGVNVSAIDMINEKFIRTFRLGLLEMLRSSPRVNPTQVQIVRFGDYLKSLKAPLSVNVIRMNPLRGYSIVVIDPTVVFSSLDSFFGGFGKGVGDLPPGRLFTPTETRIINMILDVFFRSLQDAWAPVMPVEFEIVSSEINPQFAQIADENDLVVLTRFEAEGNIDAQGFVDLVYPYASLKPIRE